jgi:hypothetical protein
MVKFNIVNFISSLSLEPLRNEVEFSVSQPEFQVIEDRSESICSDESTSALVLVLEEWFDKQPPVPDIDS